MDIRVLTNLDLTNQQLCPGSGEILFEDSGLKAYWLGRLEYERGVAIMESFLRSKLAGGLEDGFFYLEHDPVITYGRATPLAHLPSADLRIPCVQVSRGGLATYHGPGQLVGYIVLDLRRRASGAAPDLHDFLRGVEEGISAYLNEEWNLPAGSISGKTGVWILDPSKPRKIVSIGIGVKRWVTYHGFALNVTTELDVFSHFVPCGLENVTMTTIANELEQRGRKANQSFELNAVARLLHPYVMSALRQRGWCSEEGSKC